MPGLPLRPIPANENKLESAALAFAFEALPPSSSDAPDTAVPFLKVANRRFRTVGGCSARLPANACSDACPDVVVLLIMLKTAAMGCDASCPDAAAYDEPSLSKSLCNGLDDGRFFTSVFARSEYVLESVVAAPMSRAVRGGGAGTGGSGTGGGAFLK